MLHDVEQHPYWVVREPQCSCCTCRQNLLRSWLLCKMCTEIQRQRWRADGTSWITSEHVVALSGYSTLGGTHLALRAAVVDDDVGDGLDAGVVQAAHQVPQVRLRPVRAVQVVQVRGQVPAAAACCVSEATMA